MPQVNPAMPFARIKRSAANHFVLPGNLSAQSAVGLNRAAGGSAPPSESLSWGFLGFAPLRSRTWGSVYERAELI
jgi:hypothetical protein